MLRVDAQSPQSFFSPSRFKISQVKIKQPGAILMSTHVFLVVFQYLEPKGGISECLLILILILIRLIVKTKNLSGLSDTSQMFQTRVDTEFGNFVLHEGSLGGTRSECCPLRSGN